MAAWLLLPFVLVAGLKLIGIFPPASELLRGLVKGDLHASFIFLVLDGFSALLLVSHYLHKYGVGWDKVGWRRFNLFKAALYIFLGLVAFVILAGVVFAIITKLFHGFNADQAQVNEFTSGAAKSPTLSLIALVFIPPIIEETVFRGFIFPALADRFGLIAGIITSSLLFAVAHLQLNVSIYTFVLGCLLAIMYRKTKSIWPGILLHMLNNYLAFTAIIGK